MMKRSVNFNGMKRYRNLGANDLLATFRHLGMSDAEIKAKMLEMKAAREQEQNAAFYRRGLLSRAEAERLGVEL